jgi:hypothetical protein
MPKKAALTREQKAAQERSTYFSTIGKKGGKAILKARGPEYFREMAHKRHGTKPVKPAKVLKTKPKAAPKRK